MYIRISVPLIQISLSTIRNVFILNPLKVWSNAEPIIVMNPHEWFDEIPSHLFKMMGWWMPHHNHNITWVKFKVIGVIHDTYKLILYVMIFPVKFLESKLL